MKQALALLIALWVTQTVVSAQTVPKWVESKAHSTFPNTPIQAITPTDVGSLYAIHAGENVFYFDPISSVVLFGELYKVQQPSVKIITPIDAGKIQSQIREKALIIGPDDAPHKIIEFLTLDCSFCAQYNDFISKRNDVQRFVFFVLESPSVQGKKLNHVLCSATPTQAMSELYQGKEKLVADCQERKPILTAQNAIVERLGVNGFPLIVVDGKRVEGFQREKLISLLL